MERNQKMIPGQGSGDIHQAILPELAEHVIRAFLVDHFRTVNLLRDPFPPKQGFDQTVISNKEFWERMISDGIRPLSRVLLNGNFQIVEWFPRSPGLFHTEDASQHRREAKNYVQDINGILHYQPYGKLNMIQGGLGSVRFKPIRVEGLDCWLCTATNDGYCHSGIPLAVPDPLLQQIGSLHGKTFSITGQVRFLPDFMEHHFGHMAGVPQVYVLADEIKENGRSRQYVELTPMIYFVGKKDDWGKKAQSVTYVCCYEGASTGLTKAIDWIRWYVGQYGEKIITNFDQQRPAFSEAPFSLQALMSARIDLSELEHLHVYDAEIICNAVNNVYKEVKHMTQISVVLGDGTVVKGDFVVANSIKNSFNKVDSSDASQDIKTLLKDLTKAVATMTADMPKSEGTEVARDLEALTAEATSQHPRQRWWELSIDGLTKAAKAVGAVGQPVIDILVKLVPLLGA